MKKLLFAILLFAITFALQGQDQTINGATFKTGGYVGIGTISPRFNLDIKTNNTYEGNNLYFGDRRFYLAGITGTGSQMYGGMILSNIGSGIRSLDFVSGNNDFSGNSNPDNLVLRLQSNNKVG